MSGSSSRNNLANRDFFRGLKPEFIGFLVDCAHETQLARDAVLFREEKAADKFYLIRDGSITIEIPAISGPSLEVQTLGRDRVLGWSWLIPPYRWRFQARAEERTDLLEFDGTAVRERCERDSTFGYEILKRFSTLMSERLEAARLKMMDEWNPPGFA